MEELIVKNLEYSFRGPKKHFTLEIPFMQISSKGCYGILGKNGSGKTTLLNLLGGHYIPQNGEILWNGINISRKHPRKRVFATVFQDILLFPNMTVKKNIEFAINHKGKQKSRIKNKLSEIIMMFGLSEIADKKPHELSIGQQQRVAIGRAIATDPKILLLDEPTSALDYEQKQFLKDTINKMKQNRIIDIIVIVSHDLQFIREICDSFILLEEGRLIATGNTTDMLECERSLLVAQNLGYPNVFKGNIVGGDNECLKTDNDDIFRVKSGRIENDSCVIHIDPARVELSKKTNSMFSIKVKPCFDEGARKSYLLKTKTLHNSELMIQVKPHDIENITANDELDVWIDYNKIKILKNNEVVYAQKEQ